MTPGEFIAAFDVIAEAPGGIERLRELVLQLAVRGKLVPQDANEEPASVLLERIADEKFRLFREGKLGMPKPLSPIATEEAPFEIPDHWEWVRSGDITNSRLGKMLDKSKNKGPYRLLLPVPMESTRIFLSSPRGIRADESTDSPNAEAGSTR